MARRTRRNFVAPEIWPIESNSSNYPLVIEEEAAFQDLGINAIESTMTTTEPTVWKTNPFSGSFNPATKTGQQIFLEKTRGLPDGTRYDAADGSLTERANLITQHSKISLQDVQRAALKRFGTEVLAPTALPTGPFPARDIDPENNAQDKVTFYDRVDGSVLAKLIEDILTANGYQDLLLHQDSFSFADAASGETHYDGPTMLKILLSQIDPDTIVGMDSLKAQLETDSMRRHLYTALKTGPNADYNAYIQRIVDDIQSGHGYHRDITCEELIIAARTKFNNMVEDKTWGKVDLRDAKILALTTKLEKLEQNHQATLKSNASAHTTDGGSNKVHIVLPRILASRRRFHG